ncbi:MAG TPA: M3 family metallopeptidase [Woeseiaceae bacterium]|nr:M3 family metallopeptidase [Woeseiaceae bacterium]
MKRRGLLLLMTLFLSACGQEPAAPTSEAQPPAPAATEPPATANPLLAEWDTPHGVPPFDRIRPEHYLPALREGMRREQAQIAAIVENPEPPTFANTVEALERAGAALEGTARVFYAVNGAHSDEVIRETAKTIAPELSGHNDDILLNPALFARIDAVWQARDRLDLDAEAHRLLEETHKGFVLAGAALGEEARARLKEINGRLAVLEEQFQQNVLEETNRFELLVANPADLGELPASLVASAAAEAERRGHDCEDCWVFTLQRPSIEPFLEYSPNRELRKRIFTGYAMRGDQGNEADNNAVVTEMVTLRAERARLLGFDNHAAAVLVDRMAQTPERVYALLDEIWQPALAMANRERDALTALLRADGIEGQLKPWDWRYYTEKLRKQRYDFDEQALRPWFEFSAVRAAAFELAGRLFGLTFEQRPDLPRWHPDQQVFEVFDADGSHLAILYMDWFARESKRGGAWMNALRQQSDMDGFVTPVVTNNFNFPAPAPGQPALLRYSEAETLFHEFGHALHGMLSEVRYPSLAGTSTARDFVEMPSQVMENWLGEPEMLKTFRHHETGEPLPDELIHKIQATAKFNQGFRTVEYMAASYLDMAYHRLEPGAEVVPAQFEGAEMERIGLIDDIIPRYRSTYFRHIFSSGYSAGYYSYLWSEVMDADIFQAFREQGLFDPDTAAAFREEILSKGGTRPGLELFRAFRGRDPVIEPLLERRGLLPERPLAP